MNKYYLLAMLFTAVIHYFLVVAMAVAAIMVLLYEPWYVSLPLVVWIVNLSILPVRCPLTSLENYFRKKLGFKPINSFIRVHILGKDK